MDLRMRWRWRAAQVLELFLLAQVITASPRDSGKHSHMFTDADEISVEIMRHGEANIQHNKASLIAVDHHEFSAANGLAGGLDKPKGAPSQDAKGSDAKNSKATKDEGNLGEWCGWWASWIKGDVKCEAPARNLDCPENINKCCVAPVPLRIPTKSQRKKGSSIFKDSTFGKCDRLINDERSETVEENKELAQEVNSSEWDKQDADLMLIDCTSGFPEQDESGARDDEVLRAYEKFRPWNDDPSTCCSGKAAPAKIDWFLYHRFLGVNESKLYCTTATDEIE